jgi:2-(3-amino-3-carboxypropyl)histidine synthase
MPNELFDLEETKLHEEIRKRSAKKVLLQLPEGLKPQGPRLAEVIEKTGALVIVSGDPCYGACDLPLCEAESLEADLIVHYGHSKIMKTQKTSVPIVYIEAKAKLNIEPAVEKAVPLMKPWKKIGLATTIQHADRLEQAKKILEKAEKTVYIGNTGHGKRPGQILGCDYANAKAITDKVEAFLFIGGGRFHPLGLFLATMKPTVVADPFENTAYVIDEDAQKIILKRWANINEAKNAQIFGVIVGLKPGQTNIQAAVEIKEELEKNSKRAVLLALREINPASLMQFPTLDAYVNTACPRVAFDESSGFKKPVLTIAEAYVALGKTEWEDLLEKGLL